MLLLRKFILVIGGFATSSGLLADEAPPIRNPADLWRGFEPESAPLEVESIRTWDEREAAYETLRFTGEEVAGGKVRVFAIQGAPRDGEKLPGILHVHGGGQTASLDWVRFWVQRGYVCVSFDFTGPWADRKDVTDWGPIKHANMAHAAGGFQLKPTPRESAWYHWAAVSRRALTLLARHPRVDADRMGVFGISIGGSLTWMIAGFDRRVKVAVPIYGCGYNYDRRNVRWGSPEPTADWLEFQRVLGPEAHAPYVECPVLFLNATNDFHGLFDRAFETLDAVPADVRQAFTPYCNHHIAPPQGARLPAWMDWHLKDGPPVPRSPRLSIELNAQGVPAALVRVAAPEGVQLVEVFYTLGDKRPPARFWRSARVEHDDDGWSAELPIVDPWDDLRAFANVTYDSGVCLSSRLRTVVPAQLGKARATLAWSARLEQGEAGAGHWYFTSGYTDPLLDKEYLRSGNDPAHGPYVAFNLDFLGDPIDVKLSTHIVGDAQFTGPDGASLAFDCRGAFNDAGLTVTAIADDWGRRSRKYTAKIPQSELTGGWREITIPASKFIDAEGSPLANWKAIDKLELEARCSRSAPPQFKRWRWETGATTHGDDK